MSDHSRQYGKSVDQIRADHVHRYEFAAARCGNRVLDAACGCGYGSAILSKKSRVVGVDAEIEAINWAEKYFPGAGFLLGRIEDEPWAGQFDTVVSFETLEHLRHPETALKSFAKISNTLIASVPNEDLYPFFATNFQDDEYPHHRHYKPMEFAELLRSAGWKPKEWFCQKDKSGEVLEGTDGMFIICVANR